MHRPQGLVLAALVDGGIPFCLGAYMTLQRYRIIGPKSGTDFRHDKWLERYDSIYKWGGLFLIVFGVITILEQLVFRSY